MKINKFLIVLQLSLMYISQVLILVGGLVTSNEDEALQQAMSSLFLSGVIVAGVVALLSFAILVPVIISIFKKNNEDMTKFTLIVKLIAIPWYILNFILCLLLVSGMMNPFLLLGIPFMVAFFVCITYINMFVVSANNVAVIISELKFKQIKFNPLLIVGVIFHFIFCLDVLGSIFTFISYNKNKEIVR